MGGTAMAKPERRDPAKEAFWRRMLSRFDRSTSTARDFCFEHGLSEANFYAWRREIARRDREAPGSSGTAARPSAVAASPVFVNIRVADAELADLGIPKAESATSSGAADTPIEVILAKPGTNGQRRLLVRPGFDADTLRQLLPLLESEEPKAANSRASDNRDGSTESVRSERSSC
jgi:transposase-like protein